MMGSAYRHDNINVQHLFLLLNVGQCLLDTLKSQTSCFVLCQLLGLALHLLPVYPIHAPG